jgi:hypothetical protein
VQIVNKTAAVQISDLAIDVIPRFKTWLSSKVTFSCDASGYEGERRVGSCMDCLLGRRLVLVRKRDALS